MRVFLSAIEPSTTGGSKHCPMSVKYDRFFARYLVEELGIDLLWNLVSFYYARKCKDWQIRYIRDKSELLLVDSGAHSLQKGAKIKWNDYVTQYAQFIADYDSPKVLGFFEMDADNIIGYQKALEYRKYLEEASDKIIPVWHRNRGLEDFKAMCRAYEGKVVAITGFKNEDILDHQYLMFWKYAHDAGCRIHCLGMTRREVLDKVPFDYVDSSSWKMSATMATYARTRQKAKPRNGRMDYWEVMADNYLFYRTNFQTYYRAKWKAVCDRD